MASNEVGQRTPRAFAQLSDGMYGAGGRMVFSPAITFDVGGRSCCDNLFNLCSPIREPDLVALGDDR